MDEHNKILNAKGQTLKAGGVVVHSTGTKKFILLIYRPKHQDWQFPKGHVENNESLEQAAMREVQEECGIKVKIISPLPPQEYITENKERVFCAMYLMHPLSIEFPTDTDESPEWVALEMVEEKLSHKNLQNYFKSILSLV